MGRPAPDTLLPAPLAPFLRIGGRNRGFNDLLPVERDTRVLGFKRAPQRFVERLPADFHIGRRSEPVENPRADFSATVGRRLDEIEMFVASFVATESKKRH